MTLNVFLVGTKLREVDIYADYHAVRDMIVRNTACFSYFVLEFGRRSHRWNGKVLWNRCRDYEGQHSAGTNICYLCHEVIVIRHVQWSYDEVTVLYELMALKHRGGSLMRYVFYVMRCFCSRLLADCQPTRVICQVRRPWHSSPPRPHISGTLVTVHLVLTLILFVALQAPPVPGLR